MVFQHFELFPHLSIIDNLTLAQVKVLNRDKAASRAKGLKLLERVGLSAHADKYPAQLSVWIPLLCCLTNRLPHWIRK